MSGEDYGGTCVTLCLGLHRQKP